MTSVALGRHFTYIGSARATSQRTGPRLAEAAAVAADLGLLDLCQRRGAMSPRKQIAHKVRGHFEVAPTLSEVHR